jgi:hypothetical protein
MAYLGSLRGPRESVVIETLGPEYFGITAEQLAYDVSLFEESERLEEVQPVFLDSLGRPYIILSRSGHRERYLLDWYDWGRDEELQTRKEPVSDVNNVK